MPYTVALPDGRTVEFPDSVSREDAAAIIRRQFGGGAASKESTIGSEIARGAKQLVSTTRTGLGALISPEEAARAGVERSQQIAAEAGEGPSFAALRKAYEERGLLPAAGELVSQIPRALAGQLPQLAALAGGAKLGAMAGTAVAPGVGTIAGGVLGAGATLLPQFFGTNVERQAAEQMERGEPVSIDRTSAAAAAAGQAGIEAAGTAFVLGKRVVKGLLGVTDDAALATAKARDELVKAAARSRLGAAGRGAAVGLAEIPVEVAQAVIERAQAGLDVLSPEAISEYGENAYLAGLVGPTIGAATRVTAPSAARQKLAIEEQAKAAEERKATAAAEEAKKKDPQYLLDLDTNYQAAVERMKELQAAVPKRPAKGALPEEQMAYKEAVEARNTHLKEVLQPLAAEYVPRKAEIAQLKERQRVEGMTPLKYQMEQAGVDLTAPPKEERVFTGEEEITPPPAPELTYAQQQMALAQQQDMGTFEAKDFAQYLMQDPAMAQRLVETKTAIPGVSKRESDAILGGIKLQLQDRVKQERAATQAELQQRQADFKAQQVPEEADPLAMWKASVEETEEQATDELLRPNFETLRPTGPATVAVAPGITPIQNPTTLLKRLDDLIVTRDKAAAEADSAFSSGNKELGVKKSQEREAAQTALNNLEQTEGPGRALTSLRKAQDTALMNAAQLTDDLKAGRTLGGQTQTSALGINRKDYATSEEYEAALENAKREERALSSFLPKRLIVQINKQRDAFVTAAVQEAATTRKLFAKALTQDEATAAAKQMRDVFNEWVTRSMAQPRAAVDWTDKLLARMQAERAVEGKDLSAAPWVQTMKQDFIRAQMTEALTKRLGRQRMEEIAKGTVELKGAETELPVDTRRAIQSKASVDFDRLLKTAQEKALAQSTDPRPLEERRFGAYRRAVDVLKEQLNEVATNLRQVPREFRREEQLLKMQFPETEAAKVAEARGETAQTAEGAMRRKRDYVSGLIEQALRTRKVPGIAEGLLERVKDLTDANRGVGALLDAAEDAASRILKGQVVERRDLVTLRDEIRAERMRPGEAEVVGERVGQRELFPAEERRKDLGVIRETRERFENAPIVRKSRALLAQGKQLVENIKTAWDEADTRAAALRELKTTEAKEDVAKKRAAYKETFDAALNKYKLAEAVAPIQKQIDDTISLLATIGKRRAKAVKEKDKETQRDLDVILQAERDALAELRKELESAKTAPGAFVEPAELPDGATRTVRGFTQPYELKAVADEWVVFERERLAKAEAKLEKLKGPERQAQTKVVADQRTALVDAEQAQKQAAIRAQQGLGLPGVRRKAGKVSTIESAEKQAAAKAQAEAEQRAAAREDAAARNKAKEEKQTELEQRILDLGTERADKVAAISRARTPESKKKLAEEIRRIDAEAQIAQAQLETLGEVKPRRKGPATAISGAGLARQRPLRTGYRKALEAAEEGMRSEREGETRVAGTLEFGPQDVLFTAKRPPMSADEMQAARAARAARETTGMPRIEAGAPDSAFYKASGFQPDASAPFHKMTLADAARFGASKARGQRKELFTRLADLFDEATTPEKQGLVFATNGRRNPEGAAGAFYRKSNVIFTPSTDTTNYLETLLHELTHAASWYALSVDKRLAGRVESLRRKAAAWAETKEGNAYIRRHALFLVTKDPQGNKGIYGLTNVDEFLSELYADREFQKFLTQIPSDAPKKNLLTRFVEFMSSFFSAPDQAQQSLFAEAVALSEEVLETTRREIYGTDVDLRDVRRGMFPFGREGPPDVAFSAKLPTASRVADSLIAKEKGWLTKLKENFLGMGGRTQYVDKLAPSEEALKRGGTDPTKALQAMYYLRMYDQRMHFTSQSITDGVPELVEKTRRDGQIERLIETKPGANIQQIVDILKGKDVVKAAGSADAANKLFTLYLAAIRGERVGYDTLNFGRVWAEAEVKRVESQLKATNISQEQRAVLQKRKKSLEEKIPTMPTAADIKAARAEIEADPTLKEAFDKARDIYNQYNRNLLEFSVQTGALSREQANEYLRNNDYIPYYRMRDGVAEMVIGNETPIRIGNLKDSPHLKELVGGDEAIFDFLTSSVQNTSMLLDMATKNLATKNLMFELRDVGLATVSKVPKSGKVPEGAVTFKRDGEDYFAVVDTEVVGLDSELLVKGLAGIPTMFPAFVRVMGVPARFLRRAVVASPVYMARQLFRDTLAASMTSGADIVPVLSALKQIGKPNALQGRGITGGQVFTGMPEDVTRMLKDMQAGKISVTNGLAWLEAKSAQVDALTRQAQYESYLKQGLSEMEATYMALESMNFSKRGLSPTIHMLSTLIPFFNAQIQGLDVLYKAFTGKMPMNERVAIREKLWTRGMMLFGMSVAYAMYMQDDETYKNAKPEEKYGNWFVRVPGFEQMVRLPIPFELGYVFKALPEALVNIAMREDGAEEAMKALKHIAQQMVPGGSSFMIPQALKPALEVLYGKSLYTLRDIESAREQMVEPGYRYRDNTTALAREVGELTGFSPIKMEYLIRGYTGGMGMALLAALSAPFGKEGPEAATKRASDLPVVGTLFQPKDASGIIDATYEKMTKVNQLKETYEDLLNKGRTADAQQYYEKHKDDMVFASLAGSFKQFMGEITQVERAVRAAPNLTPDQKRQKLDELRQAKIRTASSVREMVEKSKRQAAPV